MIYPQHNILSDVPRGYVLNPCRGLFSVILPEATTNLIINPSFERTTANYAAAHIGTSIDRVDDFQRWGTYSGRVTPTAITTAGIYYSGSLSFTAGTTYTGSVYVRGAPGKLYRMFFSDNSLSAGNPISSIRTFRGTGRWQYLTLTYTETSTSTDRRLYITKNGGTESTPFYVDGWQVEAKAYPTTYADGDMVGFIKNLNDFLWSGTPHASTSTRSATTRAGGRVMNLDIYRFALLGIIGLGFNPVVNVAQPYVLIGGSNYQRTVPQDRLFSLAGQLDADTPQHLRQLRTTLENALDVNLSGIQQQTVLRYQEYRDDDEVGYPLDLVCEYVDGLGGNVDNDYAERVGITFVSHLPWVQSAYESGVQLDFTDSIADADGVAQRNPSGEWRALGTGTTSGTVNALAIGLDGKIYMGGDFGGVGGVAGTSRIAYWNPQTEVWNSMNSGAPGGDVEALAVLPDGRIVAAGSFLNMDAVANTLRIAIWDPVTLTWSAMGTGINGTVRALAVSADGGVFAGGSFTDAGGTTVVNIAKWNSPTWAALAGGVNNTVNALAYAGWGQLYVGGIFTTADGNPALRVAMWNGVVWTALGGGMGNNTVYELLIGPDGLVYAAGDFTTADSISVGGIARFNGTSWNRLAASGITGTGYALRFDRNNNLILGGVLTGVGGVAVADGLALYNGSSWAPVDINPPNTATVRALVVAPDNTLTIGYNTTGTAVVAGVETAINAGTAPTYPKVRFIGGGVLSSLINFTTGKAIYFNITLNDTEEAILDLTPDKISFVSTWRGNILNTILPGSDLATWRLEQGTNNISLLMTGTTASTEASMWWRENFKSINGATP